MMKAVLFDSFSYNCQYFTSDTEVNNGYGCNHLDQGETEEENGKEQGRCHCFCCPLGIEAEQEDLTDPENPDAVSDKIDWDGLCVDGNVPEGEILLLNVGDNATEDEKEAGHNYERYMHRYDKDWLDKHATLAD